VDLVPLNRRTTKRGKEIVEVSHRTVFSKGKGPRAYAKLQTEYAEAMAHLGLTRGRPRAETGAVHKSPATMRAEIGAAEAEARGFAEGVQAWADGRMREMDWSDKGRPKARFRADVGRPERRRLFRVCRPAWAALVTFSRRLNGVLSRAIQRDAMAAQADRANAQVALQEAQLLVDDLAARDADAAMRASERLAEAGRDVDPHR
jgi:hypothetical protein